jgi:hypothetical protein
LLYFACVATIEFSMCESFLRLKQLFCSGVGMIGN